MELFSEEQTSIVIVGGINNPSVEVLGDKNCSLPQFPFAMTIAPSLILTNNNEILSCGGAEDTIKQCYVLKGDKWVQHSELLKERYHSSAVTMPNGVYIFGGEGSAYKSEFLPNGSNTWQEGPEIQGSGITHGCIAKLSDTEIILIGSKTDMEMIKKYNFETQEWTDLGKLIQKRHAHACAVVNGEIIVAGGISYGEGPNGGNYLTSTLVIPIADPTNLRIVGPLNEVRGYFGMAMVHVNNTSTLIAFGGTFKDNDGWEYRDSVEIWNPDTESWILSPDLKLSEERAYFGHLSVPSNLLC